VSRVSVSRVPAARLSAKNNRRCRRLHNLNWRSSTRREPRRMAGAHSQGRPRHGRPQGRCGSRPQCPGSTSVARSRWRPVSVQSSALEIRGATTQAGPARPAEVQVQWSPKGTPSGLLNESPTVTVVNEACEPVFEDREPVFLVLRRTGAAAGLAAPPRGAPSGSGLAGALRCRSALVWSDHTTLLASISPRRNASFAAARDFEMGSTHRPLDVPPPAWNIGTA
jgi:hypothetical protein